MTRNSIRWRFSLSIFNEASSVTLIILNKGFIPLVWKNRSVSKSVQLLKKVFQDTFKRKFRYIILKKLLACNFDARKFLKSISCLMGNFPLRTCRTLQSMQILSNNFTFWSSHLISRGFNPSLPSRFKWRSFPLKHLVTNTFSFHISSLQRFISAKSKRILSSVFLFICKSVKFKQ